jgi:hypothetical protein
MPAIAQKGSRDGGSPAIANLGDDVCVRSCGAYLSGAVDETAWVTIWKYFSCHFHHASSILRAPFSALSMIVMLPSALHWAIMGCPLGASRRVKRLCLTRRARIITSQAFYFHGGLIMIFCTGWADLLAHGSINNEPSLLYWLC